MRRKQDSENRIKEEQMRQKQHENSKWIQSEAAESLLIIDEESNDDIIRFRTGFLCVFFLFFLFFFCCLLHAHNTQFRNYVCFEIKTWGHTKF